MISGPGVHVMPSAGDPQTEPGDCTNIDGHRWSWRALSWEGYCQGCKSWQPAWFTWRGWWLAPHAPAPPEHDRCPKCGELYPGGVVSYTDPICDDCADGVDADSIARGDSAAPETYWD
mgnify:CR=1 FL=1